MRPTAWKSTAVAAKQLLCLVKNKRSKVKDIPRGSFPFDMVNSRPESPQPMKIYSPLASNQEDCKDSSRFAALEEVTRPQGRLRAIGRYTKPTSREAEHKPSSSNGRHTNRLLWSSTRPVSGVGSSTKPRACGPQMEADLDGYNSSTETGKY